VFIGSRLPLIAISVISVVIVIILDYSPAENAIGYVLMAYPVFLLHQDKALCILCILLGKKNRKLPSNHMLDSLYQSYYSSWLLYESLL